MDIKSIMNNDGAIKTMTALPSWIRDLENEKKVTDGGSSYNKVPLVFRCVKLRADALSSIPISFWSGKVSKTFPVKGVSIPSMINNAELSLMLHGVGFWLWEGDNKTVTKIRPLNPYSMKVEADKASGQLLFKQTVGGKSVGAWTEDRVTFFKEYDPHNDLTSGVASADVALANAKLKYWLGQYAAKYFEGGAMPVTILGILGSPLNDDERLRIQGFFGKMITGLKNAFRVIALGNDIKVEKLTPDIEKLALKELHELSRADIALAFGIPQTMLEDAANYATAKEHRLSFYKETVVPRCTMFAEAINKQLLTLFGMEIHFDYQDMEIFQEDEKERASSLLQLVAAGVPLRVALSILGYELDDDEIRLLDQAVDVESSEQVAEAKRWKLKALRSIKSGGKADVEFTSSILPDKLRADIRSKLANAKTADAVRAIFADVRITKAKDPADVADLSAKLRDLVVELRNAQMSGGK